MWHIVAHWCSYMFMNCCLHWCLLYCMSRSVSQNLFHTLNPNLSTLLDEPITEPNISRRFGTSAFFHLDPISCGRSFNGWKAGFGASSMTPKWAKSSSSSLPSPQPAGLRAIHWPCGHAVTWEIHHVVICHTWSYPIGVLGLYNLYILFHLIKSLFSNFPWHLIWPCSKKIRMKSPCSNVPCHFGWFLLQYNII